MERKVVIFSGGRLEAWALELIKEGDLLVGADRGALFLVSHGFMPDAALGDFDSVTAEELAEIKRGSKRFIPCDPIDKDFTDTELALNWALAEKPAEIVLTGVLGSRFDHSLANVHLLYRALEQGVNCRIVDESNELFLVNDRVELRPDAFPNVSLLPLTEEVTGITLCGFTYPLQNAALRIGQSLGISNKLAGDKGVIEVGGGCLLVIRSSD